MRTDVISNPIFLLARISFLRSGGVVEGKRGRKKKKKAKKEREVLGDWGGGCRIGAY